jgi:hypothetical protein
MIKNKNRSLQSRQTRKEILPILHALHKKHKGFERVLNGHVEQWDLSSSKLDPVSKERERERESGTGEKG